LVSPSEMNDFFHCSYSWLLRHRGVVGIPVEEKDMLFGKCVHNIIMLYFQRVPEKPSVKEIEPTFRQVFEEGWVEYGLKDLKQRAERVIKNFVFFEIRRLNTWKQYKPTLCEEKLHDNHFVTIPDFYSAPDKTVINWKTGSLDQITDSLLRQGKIEEIVLRNNGYEVKKYLFVGLVHGRVLELPRVTDGWIYAQKAKMDDIIRNKRFTKNERQYCGNCCYIYECQFDNICLWWEI